jgi:hypothetical protein
MVGFPDISERPALANSYTVAGRSVFITADDSWSAELFERHFAGWHFSRTVQALPPEASATISVRVAPPPAIPDGLEVFEIASGGLCHTDGQVYYFENDGSIIRVGADGAPLVEVWVGENPSARRGAALARLVFNASMAAARRCGLFELHGASVVEPSKRAGVLFVGPSGSGKSTLTTQLAFAGWGYLSDDSLLLCSQGRVVEAHALRRAFSVAEPTINAAGLADFGNVLTEPLPFDPLKRRFDPRALFPEGFAESCVPAALFFPVVTGERLSRTEPLARTEVMALLLRMCPWACYDRPAAHEHLQVLSRLAQRCVAHRLLAGRDLFGNAGLTAEFIAARV